MFLKSGKYREFQFSYLFPKTNLLEHFKRNNISTLVIDQCVGGTPETRAKEREKKHERVITSRAWRSEARALS